MITVESFRDIIEEKVEHSDMHGWDGVGDASKECYELAKQMSIYFSKFMYKNYRNYNDHLGDFEGMFELYIKSKEQNGTNKSL